MNLRRRFSRLEEGLTKTLEDYRSSGNTKLIPPTEGRIKFLRKRFEDQLEQVHQQREIVPRSQDIAIAVVCVE